MTAIIGLAARGDGITDDGRFVAGAAPGDILETDGRLTPGPNRMQPACRHFGRCGGCQLQHVNDETYADFLQSRIVEALTAQGVAIPDMRPAHLSPAFTRRRAALRAERKGRAVRIGFNEGASHSIVDIAECPILEPALFALVSPLRKLLAQILPDRRTADVRLTRVDQGVDLTLSGVSIDGLEATLALTDFAQAYALARLSVDEGFGAEARWEPEPVTITLSTVAVPFPEGGFLQATADGEAALIAAVHAALGDASGEIADLFAGLGTFALSFPVRVLAVEGTRSAALALQAAANRNRRSVTVAHRDLFRQPLSAAELSHASAVILDPPRAGAREQVKALAASSVARIAYVSCNPATFARDAKTLGEGGYRLESIKPVGQFRWSTHVELVASFARQP